jgi:hypothetical protein
MNTLMSEVLSRKAAARKQLAALPFTEKIAILERKSGDSRHVAKNTIRPAVHHNRDSVGLGAGNGFTYRGTEATGVLSISRRTEYCPNVGNCVPEIARAICAVAVC